jgi:ATP-dependent RNA helicase SUPV3L1/SUV3
MIEVGRPGRPEGRRRPQGKRPHGGRHFTKRNGAGRQAPDATPIAATASGPLLGAENAASAPSGSDPQSGAVPETSKEASRPERHSRHRQRHDRDQRSDRPRRDRERPPARAPRPERREKAPDPNSPFAKLAALKAQLEADAKERR